MTLRHLGVALIVLACTVTAAEARKLPRQEPQRVSQCVPDNSGRVVCQGAENRTGESRKAFDANGTEARPRAWCGWQMRRWLGVSDPAGNLARWWARYGTNAHGPAVGALVVWRHHVGIITARSGSGWVVKSGNDGHAVRERERSLKGAIAFRWPNRVASND